MPAAADSEVDRALADLLERYPDPAAADPVEFAGTQFDLGLAWVQFDEGRGGLSAPSSFQADINVRLRSAGAPPNSADLVASCQVAAIVHALGSTHQKDRYLRRIFTAEDHWCQLFSEPGAGSDLAGIATRGTQASSGWTVSGQKTWTSGAREAAFGLLLARTDPDAPKHRGLTMFVLDMREAGIEVRPLRQMDGGARFNEVFLTDVVVADDQRLGDVGDGWRVAMQVLGTERTGASDVFRRSLDDLFQLWRAHGRQRPWLRDQVARMWIESRVLDLCALRRRGLRDGDVNAVRLDAIAKIAASEHAQRLSAVMAAVAGPASMVGVDYDEAFEKAMESDPSGASPDRFRTLPVQNYVLRTRAMSIEGGTNEISRNIIGERVLGLPVEPRVDKDMPWSEVRRS